MIDISAWGWPQFTILALEIFTFGVAVAKHGQAHANFTAVGAAMNTAVLVTLLAFGGFFK